MESSSGMRTPLTGEHERVNARLVNFAGWSMPIQYGSIVEEARHVRRAAGLFDLCHMGRLRITGPDAARLVERTLTCATHDLAVGAVRYGLLTREDGTTIDDILVYREPESFFLCVNASNKNRDVAWLRANAAGTDAIVHDLSKSLAMIALQGPASVAIARAVCADDPGTLKYYGFRTARAFDQDGVLISRTGYTGEDGFEFCLPEERAIDAWKRLLEVGAAHDLKRIGLAARDTLRLEAGMPLYGHEINDTTSPVEAGLEWALTNPRDYVGKSAIEDQRATGPARRLIGFTADDPRIPRPGYPVFDGDAHIGDVRSGSFSPVLEKNIGTAYVPAARAVPGTRLAVDLRGARADIQIVALPFYRRKPRSEKRT